MNTLFSHRLQTPLYSLMCALLALCLASCSQTQPKAYYIGVSQCSSDAWRTKLNEEMQRELLFHPEIKLEVRSADDDNERQQQDIAYFIEQGVDLLVVSPNQADMLEGMVAHAYEMGIPVIMADRNVNGEKYTAFVGGDNLAVGHLMGQYLKMKLPDGGKVVEVLGLEGSTPATLRHQGLMESLSDVPPSKYQILQCHGNWFQELAEQSISDILRQHPDIDIVLAQNDLMAIGAHNALERILPGNHVIIMGVDGLTGHGNGVEAIADGRVNASAVYATGGDLIIQTAVKILNGEPYDRINELATYLIEPETAPLMNNIYNEVNHQIETIQMLKDRVDYYWQQHNLEQTLLYTLVSIVVLVILLAIVIYRNYYQKHKLSQSLTRQKETLKQQRDQLAQQRDQLAKQNEQLTRLSHDLEEATRAKLMFFTNVSHDFRTPLTLINGPLEQLIQGTGDADTRQQLLHLAHKNVQTLLRLVNQILDFRKYESGKMQLNPAPMDMHEAVESWCKSFQGLAYQKHIHLELKCEAKTNDAFHTCADFAKVERIFFNLMGNAFKFTPENGRITVELLADQQPQQQNADTTAARKNIILRISDTGPGIRVEHIQHIFENFYQVDATRHEGSGIGLALVKSFVELHGGTIEAHNQPVGTGTIITVTLPVIPVEAGTLTTMDETLLAEHKTQVETELTTAIEVEEVAEDEPKPIILVIDDNRDILAYMQTLLSADYRVATATTAQEGIRKAMNMVPDAIICDVMLPGTDGITCCNRLKREVNTCHIPVLLLTACSLDEQRIQGLTEGGADAYMAKPFNADVLKAQLSSLIRNHNRIRDFFAATGTTTMPLREAITSAIDDRFLSRMRQIIDQHLGDEAFGVEQLGDEIGMSRAQLYRKCKALTNYSPVELIRNTRLKRAQQMLAQAGETIAQVAYQVGFSTPSYFTKCYKDYFGENPTELVKRKGK